MRRSVFVAIVVTAMVSTSPAVLAKDIVRVPVCDLDGHCDRTCIVSTTSPFLRCGYGR
jgi:hypothetical protein